MVAAAAFSPASCAADPVHPQTLVIHRAVVNARFVCVCLIFWNAYESDPDGADVEMRPF